MISRQITKYRYDALVEEQEKLSAELDFHLEEQRQARDKGDLSENEEYAVATKNVLQNRKRLIEIANELTDVEIIEPDMGPRIGLGCKVAVTALDEKGNPIEQSRDFHLEAAGDTIIEKVIGVESPLGKAIMNGTSGSYKIQTDTGTYYYDVQKVLE